MPTPLERLNKRFKSVPNGWAKRVPNGRDRRGRSHRKRSSETPRPRMFMRRRSHRF